MNAILLALLASSASAHFKVYTPQFRPGTGKPELISPCGDIPMGNRTDFPIVGGFVNGNYGHNGTGHISAVVSATDPTADQFQKYFINVRGGANATFYAGNFSEAVDFSKVPNATDGAPVTVQMVLYNGDEVFYLCGDLTLRNPVTATATTPAASTVKPTAAASFANGLQTVSGVVMVVMAALAFAAAV
ncbi:UNVERIFIED_CONTAM: hypothetical protein HDU68_002040 [Siphonaria sp. JEL0065]|nr:hypothetical protein HDU68_002040 [Siphonaria sp. JEL0065]